MRSRHQAELDLQEQRQAEMRQFMREEGLRANKLLEPLLKRTDEMLAELRAFHKESVAESRAQRQALFRMLDKLDGRGAEPPA